MKQALIAIVMVATIHSIVFGMPPPRQPNGCGPNSFHRAPGHQRAYENMQAERQREYLISLQQSHARNQAQAAAAAAQQAQAAAAAQQAQQQSNHEPSYAQQ
jgi:hypothetical protein